MPNTIVVVPPLCAVATLNEMVSAVHACGPTKNVWKWMRPVTSAPVAADAIVMFEGEYQPTGGVSPVAFCCVGERFFTPGGY